MDWILFWTAFGAIGTTVGSIATAAAVIVALWQTKISFKKKIKLSFSEDIAIVLENGSAIYHYVGVNICNIGNRDITIKGWGFMCNDNMKTIIAPDISSVGRSIQPKLPKKLQIEDDMTLLYRKELFNQIVEEYIKDGKISPDKKICFFVTDSTEKKYKIKTNKTASKMLNDLKKKFN